MSQSAQPSPFAVFRNRSFTLMWTGQLVSTIGDALTALTAGILVYRLTGSALSVGLMLMATSLPSLIFGLFGGVIADRYDRKRILVITCFVQAGFVALIPLVISLGLVWLYLLVGLASCARQFYSPAYESVLPELATDEELAAANSLMSISTVGSTAVGYAAAGLLAAQFELGWVFLLDALTFVFAGFCLMGITVVKLGNTEETTLAMVSRNMRRGLDYLFTHRVLRAVLSDRSRHRLYLGHLKHPDAALYHHRFRLDGNGVRDSRGADLGRVCYRQLCDGEFGQPALRT